MTLESLVLVTLFLPIIGFGFTAIAGRRLGRFEVVVPMLAVVISWLASMALVYAALSGQIGEEGLDVKLWEWIPLGVGGSFSIQVGFFVDNLTACLLIVVTTIGMLVHLYSIGYMAHDPGRWRFFAYLNLFMFSMLLLVLADNFLVLFVAWELVGLCSYLLIGFWYRRRSAALAAKKAFLVNRVGDLLFIFGIIFIFVTFGTLNIQEVLHRVGELDAVAVTVMAVLLFGGAVGKSAQFPLHVWLPDAMEGPTPVSALIHAATMVNAGVYLLARISGLLAEAPQAMVLIAAIGIFTSILAASIALTQTDIKRVLAYSTLSQLGYMFTAIGIGAFTAAIFHLMAHGFIKGLLFLGSGSVIHAVHEEQDMRRMGGLSRRIPITHWTMLIGALAIAGIPPLAAFFSKDSILDEAFIFGYQWIWVIGLVVAGMTAFYMFRLMGMTFYGKSRVDPHVEPLVHESPRSMTVPLILLAIPSAFLGLALTVGGPPLAEGVTLIGHWLEPVFAPAVETLHHGEEAYQLFGINGGLLLASVAVAVTGMVVAWFLFGFFRRQGRPDTVRALTARLPFLYRASLNKWWFDDLNHLVFYVIGSRVAGAAWWFDRRVVDGTVNGIGTVVVNAGRGLGRIQTGRVQNYALGIAVGLLVMAGGFLILSAR